MRDLYLDVDNTILNSSKALVECYSQITGEKPLKQLPLEWNLKDIFPNADKNIIHKIFESQEFIDRVELFDGAYDVIKALSEKTNIHLITVGTPTNLELKRKYFQEKLPFCNYIGLEQHGKVFDKSCVKDAILVDDRLDNLNSTINTTKVLFRYKNLPYQWQDGWEDQAKYVLHKWDDMAYLLLNLLIKLQY